MVQIGDMIKCHDPEDMVDTMTELAAEDIETDSVYERDGKKGYWLEVIKDGKPGNGRNQGADV